MFQEPLGSIIFICRGIALDGIAHDGFCQTIQGYISLDILDFFMEKNKNIFGFVKNTQKHHEKSLYYFYEHFPLVKFKVIRVMACFSTLAYRNLSLLLKLEQKASSNFDILDKRGQEGSEGVHKWRTSISRLNHLNPFERQCGKAIKVVEFLIYFVRSNLFLI